MTKNRSSNQSDSRGGTYQRYGQRRQPPEYRGKNDSRQRDSRGRDNRNDRSTPRFNTSRSRDRYGRPHPRNRTGSSYRGRVKSGDRYAKPLTIAQPSPAQPQRQHPVLREKPRKQQRPRTQQEQQPTPHFPAPETQLKRERLIRRCQEEGRAQGQK